MSKIETQTNIIQVERGKSANLRRTPESKKDKPNAAPLTLSLAANSTYRDVDRQLQKLGFSLTKETDLKAIASANGNNTFEGDEIESLEKILEKTFANRGEVFWEGFAKRHPEAFTDVDFLRHIIGHTNAQTFRLVPEELRSDADFVLRFLQASGCHEVIPFCGNLPSNLPFGLAAMRIEPKSFYKLDRSLKENPEHLLKLIAISPEVYAITDSKIADEAFSEKAYSANFAVYFQLPKKLQRKFRDDFHRRFQKFDIEFPQRFRSETMAAVLKNRREAGSNNGRDLAVTLATKVDGNQVFELRREIFHALATSSKYQSPYYEVATKTQVLASLKEASHNGRRPVKLLYLAGHGTEDHLSLGGADPAKLNPKKIDRDRNINIDDHEFFQAMAPYLAEDVVIILDSCSNGKGEHEHENLANAISRHKPGAQFYAGTLPYHHGVHFEKIGSDGEILDVKMLDYGQDVTYRLKPWLQEVERLMKQGFDHLEVTHHLIQHYPDAPISGEDRKKFENFIQKARDYFHDTLFHALRSKLSKYPEAKFYADYDHEKKPAAAQFASTIAPGWKQHSIKVPGLSREIPVLISKDDQKLWPLYEMVLREDFELAKALLPPEQLEAAMRDTSGNSLPIVFAPHAESRGKKTETYCQEGEQPCPVDNDVTTLVLQPFNKDSRLADLHHQFFSQIGERLSSLWSERGLSNGEKRRLARWLGDASPYFGTSQAKKSARRLFALQALNFRGQVFRKSEKKSDIESKVAREFTADLQSGKEISWSNRRLRQLFRDAHRPKSL